MQPSAIASTGAAFVFVFLFVSLTFLARREDYEGLMKLHQYLLDYKTRLPYAHSIVISLPFSGSSLSGLLRGDPAVGAVLMRDLAIQDKHLEALTIFEELKRYCVPDKLTYL